jgi:hypothetical protein
MKAMDAEAVDLYRTIIAYSGAYSIDGNKVIYKIEYSWNQRGLELINSVSWK